MIKNRPGNKDRFLQIWNARTAGETYISIAKRFGLTSARIQAICREVERRQSDDAWHRDMSSRAVHVLQNAGILPWDDTKLETLIEMIESGQLRNLKMCGDVTVNEIRAALLARGMWVDTSKSQTEAYERLAHQYAPC